MTKIGYFLASEEHGPNELVRQARLAEEAGFDGLWISDHYHPWIDEQGESPFVWAVIGALSQAVSLPVTTAVTCPIIRIHPVIIAQAAATAQVLLDGRFRLGVGTGEAINEIPLGYEFPGYAERIERMGEALEILRRLLGGEKLDFDGTHYTTRAAKLYSPPLGTVPIWMAAGGPKSATFAGRHADGLITSVKDPAETLERVIGPYREAAAARGAATTILATRWCVLAADDDEAWEALAPMRGLRAPGRLEVADPMILRQRADEMDRAEILGKYTVVRDLDALAEAYRPLVTDVGADYVAIQVASVDPERTIAGIGAEVLPRLRDWAGQA